MSPRKKKKKVLREEILGICLSALALIMMIGMFSAGAGIVGDTYKQISLGVWGLFAYGLPVVLVGIGVYLILYADKKIKPLQIVMYAICGLSLIGILHLALAGDVNVAQLKYWDCIQDSYELGRLQTQGMGAFAALFVFPIKQLLGIAGAYVLFGALLLISLLFIGNVSLRQLQRRAKAKAAKARSEHAAKREERQRLAKTTEPEEDDWADWEPEQENEEPTPIVHRGSRRSRLEAERQAQLRTKEKESVMYSVGDDFEEIINRDDDIELFPGVGKEAVRRHIRKPDAVAHMQENGFEDELFGEGPPQDEPIEIDLTQPWYAEQEEQNDPQDEDAFMKTGEAPDTKAHSAREDLLPWQVQHEKMEPVEPEVAKDVITKAQTARLAKADIAGKLAADTPAYKVPPVSMLSKASGSDIKKTPISQVDTKAAARQLEQTFSSFGVAAKVVNVRSGPVITQYEVQPAPGVRVNRIANLSDDIALSLAAPGVRIEAPIPGKNAIGIEVPNKKRSSVMLRDVLESGAFRNAKSKVSVALGKNIAGDDIVIDLASMPHLLIAGTTGSGKSVCVNSLIVSLLFKATPEEVKLIMIDPKVVELSGFNGIPHLMVPVVTDPKKAAGALQWALSEMLRRYNAFADRGAKDIGRYNDIMKMTDEPVLPYLVVIIDELADLMMASPREVEDSICRIAQMGRACGIHLVVATQRPSVDVITGLIKANFPSRIAFAVSSQTDSRTILDQSGAEKLLGKGDMLFHTSTTPKPVRIQGAFVSDPEVEAVIDYVKASGQAPEYSNEVIEEMNRSLEAEAKNGKNAAPSGEKTDAMVAQAAYTFVEAGQASTSLIQRKLRLGYGRAARIIDELEEMGIVGPPNGSRPRKVLVDMQECQQLFGEGDSDIES